MKKVLFIRLTPTSHSDGTNTHCVELSKLFLGDSDICILPIINFKVHKLPFLNVPYHKQNDIELAIKKYSPDIVHVHGTYNFAVISAIKVSHRCGVDVIWSPHFHPFKYLNRPFEGEIFFHCFIKKILNVCKSIITINNEDTVFFKKFTDNVFRIPHWNRSLNQYSNENNIIKNNNMILFVGRLDSNKGLEHLFSIPKGKYEIHIVGDGDYLLREDFVHHKNISWEELHTLYEKASLLVVPSRYEAFSYVALEALTNNTPIVISDRVRIGDYLEGLPFVSVFPYHNMKEFNISIDKTIGKNVNINLINSVFNKQHIKELYKNIYIS